MCCISVCMTKRVLPTSALGEAILVSALTATPARGLQTLTLAKEPGGAECNGKKFITVFNTVQFSLNPFHTRVVSN